MPAGLSQITQSKVSRSSPTTRATPSLVSASLSRVWEAASRLSESMRLSRIRACGSLASPWATLMRSYTTRRSAPITRSRLRRPTSKSTTTTLSPPCANAAPRAAVVVVLPTPPLPDVTTSTFAIQTPSCDASALTGDPDCAALKPGLHGPPEHIRRDVVGCRVMAVDGQKLGFERAAEDARLPVARRARDRSPAQRAVDVDRAARDDFCARADGSDNGQVAVGEEDRLTGSDRALDHPSRRLRDGSFRWQIRGAHRLG